MENVFDGTQNGWSVELLDNVNIGEWLRQDEENAVFKIIITINGELTEKYYLCNLNNLEQTLSTIFFGCDINTRILLNKTYVNLKYIGLDHFLLEYTDDLWQFFFTNPNDDINSENSFGDQTISSRKRLAKRCFYLKTNEQTVSISATPIKIPSNAYNDYHLRNILPPINCSQIDSTYMLVTNVEHGIFKNNLDEESSQEQSNISTISSVTSKSYNFLNKPSPDNSQDDYSNISGMTTPERGGRTRKRKHKNKLKKNNNSKKSKQSKNLKKQKKTKKIRKNKRKSNK
jgi:hypothetical protein